MSDFDAVIGSALSRTLASAEHLEEQLEALRQDYNAELAARVEAERERDEARAACADVEELRKLGALRLIEAERFIAAADKLRTAAEWAVARDGGRYCERCEGEVTRGQAYELQSGTGGLIAHIHCPDKEATDA
jgi:hypothetical protein